MPGGWARVPRLWRDGSGASDSWCLLGATTALAVVVAATAAEQRRQRRQKGTALSAGEVAQPNSSSEVLTGVATKLAEAIEEALAKVEGSSEAPDIRVKYLGPLIEKQRVVLEAHGIKSFKDYESEKELFAAGGEVDHALTAANARLSRAEQKWRSVLNGLEGDANTDMQPKLKIGDPGPAFELLEAESGKMVSLADLLEEGPSCIIIVWLRHFG